MDALDDMGMTNSVMICTHSDFNRTMQSNINLGSDHAWGNHQIILGGGIAGGRILGDFPDLELGGVPISAPKEFGFLQPLLPK